jgi:tetratricopeptide (TPR) repeat protein
MHRYSLPILLVLTALPGCARDPLPDLFRQGVAKVADRDYEEGVSILDKVVAENTLHASAFYWMGVAQQGRGHHADAVTAFSKAMAVDDEIAALRSSDEEDAAARLSSAVALQELLADVLTRRGNSSLALGNWDQARRDFSQAIALNSRWAPAYLGRARVFLEGKPADASLPDVAIGDLNECLALGPRNPQALRLRARAYVEVRNPTRAILDATELVRLESEDAGAYRLLGCGYLADGNPDLARACFRQLRQVDPAQAGLADSLIKTAEELKRNRDAVDVRIAFERDGAPRVFLETRTRIREDVKPSPKPSPDGLSAAGQHYESGLQFLWQQKWDAAIAEFQAAVEADMNHANAYYYRGLAYLEKGTPDTAIADFTEAIRLAPDLAEAYCQRGRACLVAGELYLAAQDCTTAIRIRPKYADAYYFRGLARLRAREYSRAIADLQETQSLSAGFAETLRPDLAEAHGGRGLDALRSKQWSNAILDLKKALELDPGAAPHLRLKLAEAYYRRGVGRQESGLLEQARADLQSARELGWPEATAAASPAGR